ncbi:hypothetical protein M409DRAFT_20798 [Zasmidium cellare ATCC 36951]|uniref:NACHT domain-containing protein n=1 Tax=Zasmidium cellare ATCC 36951 TaxID=1080233 RepID=A0A6A6CNZ6_ZASCE|nr:uncharacterized protein M409DRAFT_20798 [Zasmidium cellare ATCC 36951]KAF2168781.1 hypothetical protein M409DRAFT_20798 [Zasmidium cellare ATCC 36951]
MSLTRRFKDALRSSRGAASERWSTARGREEEEEPIAQNSTGRQSPNVNDLAPLPVGGASYKCSLVSISRQRPSELSAGSNISLIVIPGLRDHGLAGGKQGIRDSWLCAAFDLVFYFDYPRDVLVRNDTGQVDRCAEELLRLADATHGSSKGLVLLLCHGMGGILAKKAFCFGQATGARRGNSIKGIIFFGTPHQSSALCDFPTVLCNILTTVYHGELKANVHASIKKKAADLSAASDEFARRSSALHMSSFYEECVTAPVDYIIVDKSAATISSTAEQPIALPVDHHEMCQTLGSRKEVRDLVGKVIQHTIWELLELATRTYLHDPTDVRFANTSSSIAQQGIIHVQTQNIYLHWQCISATLKHINVREWFRTLCLDCFLPASPPPNTRHDAISLFGRESHIADHTPGTLGWVESDPTYSNWRTASSSHTLLVSGYAGCGKSVLSFHVTEALRATLDSESLTCRYFFDGTIQEQSNLCNLFRSLIYQFITVRRKLTRIVKKEFNADPAILSDSRRLWRLFSKLATHKRTRTLWLVIDALDECNPDDQKILIRDLLGLTTLGGMANVKILVTCRTHSAAASAFPTDLSSATRLKLEDKAACIRSDVDRHIEEHVMNLVKDHRCPEPKREALETALKNRSEATFLWISLTLSVLHERRLAANDDIFQIVNAFPSGLTQIYDTILNAIPKQDFDAAIKVLRTISASNRRLNVAELNAIISIQDEHQSLAELRGDVSLADENFVEKLLAGLVNIRDGQFALVHHTLKEFILDRDRSEAESHNIVAQATTRYLLLEDFQFDIFQDQSPQTPISPERVHFLQKAIVEDEAHGIMGDLFKEPAELSRDALLAAANRFELFDYAARFWHMHFAKCQNNSLQALQESALELYSADKQENWYHYLCHVDTTFSELPSQPDPLTLACLLGHVTSVAALTLEQDSITCGDGIYWAARNGHADVLKILLPVTSPSVQDTQTHGKSPLAAASEQGHLECVQCLLRSNLFAVNQRGERLRTALSLAAAQGHLHVISEILARDETDPNLTGRMGRTALIEAVYSESVPAVRKLLSDKRTHAGHLDNKNRSALSWACEYGLVEIAKVLLLHHRTGKRDPRDWAQKQLEYGSGGCEKDSEGWTPLMYAVTSSNLELVRLLLHKSNVQVSDEDNSGRNAISHAAQRSNTAILKHLILKDDTCTDTKDENGWSPLAWTLDPPERVANARVLLPFHCQGLENSEGLAMFILATRWGASRIASSLIDERTFAINTVSAEGRTALSFASERGNDVLVWQLLHTEGVDIDLADESGMTPSSWARAGGHSDIVRLLSKYAAKSQ